ncbi:MAG: pimeloyl-ACP methyl ester carboxylesterase [Pseudohongiellaceae bacterium]|jgi:pimeloyl-ACP methyl ester carboxylesterase
MSRRSPLARGAFACAAWALLAVASRAQAERLDLVDHLARLERIALIGDLGFAPLPAVTASSPLDDMFFADRRPPGEPDLSAYAGVPDPVLQDGFIPKGPGGTGTTKGEVFQYMLPHDYDPNGAPIPLLIAYHGFGSSAKSPAAQSTLDEEANLRGWAYLSPTGIDDQLFGSPISQQNTEAAIAWMLGQHAIDVDRLYMVGFSMGAGVSANFAARHRDPDGVMIAGLAMVSGVSDWTMTYFEGNAATKTLLKNAFNFGAHPNQVPFLYQQASGLHFDKNSYPALPGTLLPEVSMSTNLGSTPIFLTWDVADTVDLSLAQNPVRQRTLEGLGGKVETVVVSGTVGGFPPQPQTHSWAVLDVPRLCDFFEPLTADRRPSTVAALIDRSATVAHATLTQRTTGAFSSWHSDGLGGLSLLDVENASDVSLDARATPQLPVSLSATSADGDGYRLTVSGFDDRPAYMVTTVDERLVQDVASDPLSNALLVDVFQGAPLQAEVRSSPGWTADLIMAPNPAKVGQLAAIQGAVAPGTTGAWLAIAASDQLTTLPSGLTFTAGLDASTMFLPLPTDAAGLIDTDFAVPSDPNLIGAQLYLQLIAGGPNGSATVASNLWIASFF